MDFESVFAEMESDRKQGIIASKVIQDKIWYEENHGKVGTFYRVTSDGQRTLGEFIDGKFVAEAR